MLYSSVAGDVSGRPIFDAAAAGLPGLLPSRLCRHEPSFLDEPFLQPLHGLSVARKHQGLAFRESVSFARLLGPHLG
jgi:hypothetical protein